MSIMDKVRKLNNMQLFNLITAKALASLGIGVLLATYFMAVDWIMLGWIFIILAIMLQIPNMYIMFVKK